MTQVRITEKDTTGDVMVHYALTTTPATPASIPTVTASTSSKTKASTNSLLVNRLDPIPADSKNSTAVPATAPTSLTATLGRSPSALISEYVFPLFLPIGYPHTVTADYTPYQIYDSLQAFTSAITGLLASRAVLQSLGVVDAEPSGDGSTGTKTATYATLLSIAQSTIANLTTILFAHHASSRIAVDVKFYRFLADIVNDIAFLIDCLSPSLPSTLRAPALCLSSASRAVCGVAGGSSKAVLSAHFARNGNIGELNAKDGSQETLLNLVGMWAGGFVVSRVEGVFWTWAWVLSLLACHLFFNYCAVRSVRLRVLNQERATIVFADLVRDETCPDIEHVGCQEGVFRKNGLVRKGSMPLTQVRMGVGLDEFIEAIGGRRKSTTGSLSFEGQRLQLLIDSFKDEEYVLWIDVASRTAFVLLKDAATIEHQFKSWFHAALLSQSLQQSTTDVEILQHTTQTLTTAERRWPQTRNTMIKAGWDLTTALLESSPSKRIGFS